jgi:hypothetical protein
VLANLGLGSIMKKGEGESRKNLNISHTGEERERYEMRKRMKNH